VIFVCVSFFVQEVLYLPCSGGFRGKYCEVLFKSTRPKDLQVSPKL